MKVHINLGICALIASAVLNLYAEEIEHKEGHRIKRNEVNIPWIKSVGSTSDAREFPQGPQKRPDVLLREQNSLKHGKKSEKNWEIFKDSISGTNHLKRDYHFIELPRNERMDGLRSFAVRQASKPHDHVRTGILSLAAAVMFVVILVICIHAPCTCLWRRRHRTDMEVDLITCPNPTAHDGKCGKCLFDKVSKKHSSKYGFSRRKCSPPAPCTTNEELFMPYENQPPWVTDSNKGQTSKLPSPKKSRSIVQAILKRSRDRDKFRYQFLASRYGYNYKQFRDSYKRSSVYDEQDPNWYSAGEFLNNQSSFRGQKNYGSTDTGELPGEINQNCQWSRGEQKPTNQSVEDIIKLQPRRRQIVELQEFPVGYSGTYVTGHMNGKDNLLFDPMYDVTKSCRHGNGVRPASDSNIDLYFYQLDQETNHNHVTDDTSFKKTRPTNPNSSAKIVQQFPTQFEYDPKFVQNEGEKKSKTERRTEGELEDEDSDNYETSSDDLLSFDEWDEMQERRERRNQEFLYSPHMQASCRYHNYSHSYPAVLRYPDIPRDTRSLPREYKTRMRRHVARSEIELRRSSGCFGQSTSHTGQQSAQCHSSSDTSLHRMQIEKELASVGLTNKGKSHKKQKDEKMRIRDNRLEPLAGIMSPRRPLAETRKHNKNHSNGADPEKRSDLKLSDLKAVIKKENYVVKLPSLESLCKETNIYEYKDENCVVKLPSLESLCKETNICEYKDEGTLKDEQEYYKGSLEKELNNEKPEPNYSRVHLELDPHYIKNSYLRDEPVRDTDSDDGDCNTRHKNITTESHLMTKHPSQSSLNLDETFSSNRSTRL